MKNLMLALAAVAIVAAPLSAQMPSHDMIKKPQMNIVETAVTAGSFNTLVAALKAAGLADVLTGEGPFTVFAPTDEAFAKLPEGTIESLLQDTEKLTAILTYHVVAGKVMSSDIAGKKAQGTITDNEIYGNKDGIVLREGACPHIERNHIHDQRRRGVMVCARGQGMLLDNVIANSGHYNIEVRGEKPKIMTPEKAEKELEKITHEHVEHVDSALGNKEQELLEV